MRKLAWIAGILFFNVFVSSYSQPLAAKFYYVDVPDIPTPTIALPHYASYPRFLNYPDVPRLYLWGLAGSETIGRGDALLPIMRAYNSFLYTDLQAKVGSDDAWMAGGGLGYRGIFGQQIYGAYLFLDRNVSPHHNDFYVLGPGIETIHNCWEARINGYIPVSERRKRGRSFFPSGFNQCGIQEDCRFVEFQGHQQFEHRFFRFEEVGPGLDAELGVSFGRQRAVSLHGGVYYYNLRDEEDIRGVEGRIEAGLNDHVALTLEASYDNDQRGAIVGGIRLQFGQVHPRRCCTIEDHLYDRVARHLATVDSGSGIPSKRGTKDEGLFLRRDNIFFFTPTGGTTFTGLDSGTFENPLRADQFNSATLLAVHNLTGNGNFYFSTGTYNLGAITVNVLEGQSLFGRTRDYRCTAVGDERPILSFTRRGTALLVTGGNNVIDSIIVQNIERSEDVIISALQVENNPSLFICNSVMEAISPVIGGNARNNFVVALRANNSNVAIDSSVIHALASISETQIEAGTNTAVGIGIITEAFHHNNFALYRVTVQADATIGNFNESGVNLATAIGDSGTFFNNNFAVNQSFLTANATVGLDNDGPNSALGIGNNFAEFFVENNFTINSTVITANAIIGRDNMENNFAAGIGQLGGGLTADALDNNFLINNSSVFANAIVGRDNTTLANNNALVLGDIFGTVFSGNTYIVNSSRLESVAEVGRDQIDSMNTAVVLGNIQTVDFSNNTYTITRSFLSSLALVGGNNDITSFNIAAGVFDILVANANVYNIDLSRIVVEAHIQRNNAGENTAYGFFIDATSVLNLSNSFVDLFAIVDGVNTGTNQVVKTTGTGAFNISNTQFTSVVEP